MMQGKSNKAISRVLDLAEPTVKIHVSAILKALKVANRTEAVIAATAPRPRAPGRPIDNVACTLRAHSQPTEAWGDGSRAS